MWIFVNNLNEENIVATGDGGKMFFWKARHMILMEKKFQVPEQENSKTKYVNLFSFEV